MSTPPPSNKLTLVTQSNGWRSVLAIFKNLWALVALIFLLGLASYLLPAEKYRIAAVAQRVGDAFMVAAIVTLFYSLSELRRFFGKLAEDTLIQDAYLQKLSLPSLLAVRRTVAAVILRKFLTNTDYKGQELEEWVDRKLFGDILPSESPMAGIYREDFRETVTLEYISLGIALRQVGASADGLDKAALEQLVLKETTTTQYRVVTPRHGATYGPFPVTLFVLSANIPGFQSGLRVLYEVGSTERDAKFVQVTMTERPAAGVAYEARTTLPLSSGGTPVWCRVTEYRSPKREPFVLNTMSRLTRNLHVNLYVTGNAPKLSFDGSVIALDRAPELDHLPNAVSIDYEGWLLEDHGYFIWWWEDDDGFVGPRGGSESGPETGDREGRSDARTTS